MDDTELVARVLRGNRRAVRELYDRHASRIWAVVRRVVADESLAEDCAQEAWMRIYRALPGFRGDARFSSWSHRIAVNCAIEGLRRQGRRGGREEPIDRIPSIGTSDGSAVLRIALERAIDRLPDGMREVLVLHDVEGYTHVEIGEALGIAAGTSRSQLFKARARLRETMRAESNTERSEGSTCRT